MTTGATVCWLTTSAGLAAVIALQMNSELSLTSPVTAAPTEAATDEAEPSVNALADYLTVDTLDMIVERPLFSLSRRPFSPAVEQQEAPEGTARMQPLSAKLAGTMLAGSSRMALLTHPSKGLLRLREGQDVDGWRIEEVRDDEVRLERGDEVELLRLRKGTPQEDRQAQIGVKAPASVGKNDPPVGTIESDDTAAEASLGD
ncbi:MAG: hypothetical protein ACR2RA_13395 [Geminicoccaceae bacterium]